MQTLLFPTWKPGLPNPPGGCDLRALTAVEDATEVVLVKPSTKHPIQCARLYPVLVEPILLPIAHPFSGQSKEWDPVQTRFQKAPRDRANGKSRLAFICYHSNTTAGSIFYSYKKGPLCRGCGVITEKFWGNQILEKQIWETQLLRCHIRLFSHVLRELALIMAAQEGKPGFWANPHCLHWKTTFPGNGEASYFMPPTGLSPKATGELTCFISTHP